MKVYDFVQNICFIRGRLKYFAFILEDTRLQDFKTIIPTEDDFINFCDRDVECFELSVNEEDIPIILLYIATDFNKDKQYWTN